MRALVLTTRQPNQVALVEKLRREVDVVGVVSSANVTGSSAPRNELRRITRALAVRTAGRPFLRAWVSLQAHYAERFGEDFPREVTTVDVPNVNAPSTLAAIESLEPDILLVSGTNMVRAAVVAAMSGRIGVLNLHTGISPYVKGGPNCTNWCLARGWFHLIGNTVMWLDEGIDSGALIVTERTPLSGDESLFDLHRKVMDHAHALYVRAVSALGAGRALPRVPQDSIGQGRTFYNAEWTVQPMLQARANFRHHYRAAMATPRHGDDVRLVSLTNARRR